jgi:hypothetical protein
MIDRIAKALAEKNRTYRDGKSSAQTGDPFDAPWEELTECARDAYRDYARAAILGMREPTEAMIEAGQPKVIGYERDGQPCPKDFWGARQVHGLADGLRDQYRRMIEGALI